MSVRLEQIQQDETLRQSLFPVCRKSIYLAHAGVSPLPQFCVEAMNRYLGACTLEDQEAAIPGGLFAQARRGVAQLLQARETEISFVGPTSLGLSMVANGLNFARGGNVVFYPDDYPSNVYPWQALCDYGAELRMIEPRELGVLTMEDVLSQVDNQTVLVALSAAHFISGARLDTRALGLELRQREVLFCLDAIQTLGGFPTSVEGVDFLAADGHKWLLAPCAAGIFYVRKEIQEHFDPRIYGWHNVRCPNYVAQDEIVFPPDGRRYEAGSHNLVGLAGLNASVQLLLEVGIEAIGNDLAAKREFLVKELQSAGYSVLHPVASMPAGITSFFRPGEKMRALHEHLTSRGIVTSLRTDRQGQQYVRLSPHFYNTRAELEKTIESIRSTPAAGKP